MPQTVSTVLPQAQYVVNQTLIPAAAYSPSDFVVVTSPFAVDRFSSAEITVVAASPGGNVDVYVQRQLSDGVTWDSIAHFAQITLNQPGATQTLGFVHGGNLLNSTSQSIAANTVLATTMGGYWRIFVGVSANPSTFAVYGTFWQ